VLAAILKERLDGLTNVQVMRSTLATVSQSDFDCAVMLNVLEHIEDDQGVIEQVFQLLKPGGRFCVWVPAFQSLYGDFDRRIGHYRRYRRPQLVRAMEQCGFTVVHARYENFVGFFAWWAVIRLLGGTPHSGGLASIFDMWLVPVIRRVEKILRPPIGQSLYVVAVRPT
jgi:SAM-dependent methyltransferase